jgi:hypothetical protein
MPRAGAPKRALHLRRNRVVPRRTISNKLAADISAIAKQAFLRANQSRKEDLEFITEKELWIEGTAPLVAQNAIIHFMEEAEFEIPPPEFRELVKADSPLAKSIQKLIERLPGDDSAPFADMRSLYCYGVAESDGLDDDDESADGREDIWDTRFGPAAVKAVLVQWLHLMGALHRQAGKGRSPASAQFGFVGTLAAYWTDELKVPFGSSRNEMMASQRLGGHLGRHGQWGPFSEFVHKAAEGIPEKFGKHLIWDTAIREVSEKKG